MKKTVISTDAQFYYPTGGHRPAEGVITSGWPERSGGIRVIDRAIMVHA